MKHFKLLRVESVTKTRVQFLECFQANCMFGVEYINQVFPKTPVLQLISDHKSHVSFGPQGPYSHPHGPVPSPAGGNPFESLCMLLRLNRGGLCVFLSAVKIEDNLRDLLSKSLPYKNPLRSPHTNARMFYGVSFSGTMGLRRVSKDPSGLQPKE